MRSTGSLLPASACLLYWDLPLDTLLPAAVCGTIFLWGYHEEQYVADYASPDKILAPAL